MPRKRDPKTGKFQAAATAKPTGAGSRTAKKAGARSRTGKAAVEIRTVRCRVGNRIVRRPATAGA